MTNFEQIRVSMEAEQERKKKLAESSRLVIMNAMHKAGVKAILVSFSGSGDDGSIGDIVKIDELSQNIWEGEALDKNEEEENLKELVEDYCYAYLEGTGVDWYNNDGGQGTFLFDCITVPHVFECTVEYNIMHTEVGHYTEEVM